MDGACGHHGYRVDMARACGIPHSPVAVWVETSLSPRHNEVENQR